MPTFVDLFCHFSKKEEGRNGNHGKWQGLHPKEGATVTDALKALGAVPIYTAVEVDGRLVPKEDWDAMALKKDMRLEVVSFVGGG